MHGFVRLRLAFAGILGRRETTGVGGKLGNWPGTIFYANGEEVSLRMDGQSA